MIDFKLIDFKLRMKEICIGYRIHVKEIFVGYIFRFIVTIVAYAFQWVGYTTADIPSNILNYVI